MSSQEHSDPTSPPPRVYIFHGEDELSCSEALISLRQRLGPPEMAALNTSVLDGRSVTVGQIQDACDTVPFLSDRRLVIVEGLLSRLTAARQKEVQALSAYLDRLPETTRLVFVERGTLGDDHPILKKVRQHPHGYIKRFTPPHRLEGWIVQRVKRKGGAITPQAASALAEAVGPDLRQLDQELEKLMAYAGVGEAIQPEDVERLVSAAQEANIFAMVDALGRRDGEKAARLLHRLLEEGQHPLALLAMIVRQFRLLIQVKELTGAGARTEAIARRLRLHPFVARKLYAQAQNFSTAQLERIYRYLLETDLAIKTGEMADVVALDLLIAGLVPPPDPAGP